jgi:hypothetical protein
LWICGRDRPCSTFGTRGSAQSAPSRPNATCAPRQTRATRPRAFLGVHVKARLERVRLPAHLHVCQKLTA